MSDDVVSRETPPAPDVARGVFSASLPLVAQYAGLLVNEGVDHGLVGPREVSRLWERHLINCALAGRAIGYGVDVCDVGSGAGLPGLVLAICRPDLSVTLVEPLLRRTTFLCGAITELGLTNVEVVRARAEELHGKREFAVVTARAVAPLGRLLDWSMPLVRQGGCLVAIKGASAADEVAVAARTLRKHCAVQVSVEIHGSDLIDAPTTVVRVVAGQPSRLGLGSPGTVDGGASKRRSASRGRKR